MAVYMFVHSFCLKRYQINIALKHCPGLLEFYGYCSAQLNHVSGQYGLFFKGQGHNGIFYY